MLTTMIIIIGLTITCVLLDADIR